MERFIREAEATYITGISRSQRRRLEKLGRFPKRITLFEKIVGWKLSEIIAWVESIGNV